MSVSIYVTLCSCACVCVCQGYVEAGSSQTLRVCYLPGVPEVFLKSFQLQVAFYQPENISVTGEGVFPRLCMDLPRHLGTSHTHRHIPTDCLNVFRKCVRVSVV